MTRHGTLLHNAIFRFKIAVLAKLLPGGTNICPICAHIWIWQDRDRWITITWDEWKAGKRP